jgi:Ala-tRNA(Pro) deacylase
MSISAAVKDYLDRHNVRYEVIVHSPTKDSAHTAQAARVPGDQLAKAVVLEDDSGYLMAVVPATHQLDLQALDRELNREFTLASEREVAELFKDCDLGAIPPLGRAYGIDMVVEQSLGDASHVYFEAGDHSSLIHVSGSQFRKLMADSPHRHISHHT